MLSIYNLIRWFNYHREIFCVESLEDNEGTVVICLNTGGKFDDTGRINIVYNPNITIFPYTQWEDGLPNSLFRKRFSTVNEIVSFWMEKLMCYGYL